MKKNVAIGFLGINLDNGKGAGRWERWRPTVDLCRQDDFIIHRFELLADPKYMAICLLYTSPSPRDQRGSRMPSSA